MKFESNRQLLCTFANTKNYKELGDKIRSYYKFIYNNKIFVFCNENKNEELFLTYNVITQENEKLNKFSDTISIHRKKLTNTLYTLNALNKIVQDENSGNLDPTFQIQWDLYKNSLILTGDISIKIIPIKIFDIIN